MSGLLEDDWILTPATALYLSQCVFMDRVYEGSSASQRYVVRKKKVFLSAYWMGTTSNLQKQSFLKGQLQ